MNPFSRGGAYGHKHVNPTHHIDSNLWKFNRNRQQTTTGGEMFKKILFGLTALSIILTHSTGCSRSASGTLYKKSKPAGEEYELTGVVNGVWKYDVEQNKSRLEELLPEGTDIDIDRASTLHQVRVGIKRSAFGSIATEVVILPEGWTYTTGGSTEGENVVNIGDVVTLRAQENRLVDYFIRIARKCDAPPGEDEKPEWNIGCQSVSEFHDNGYGGNKYFWTGF